MYRDEVFSFTGHRPDKLGGYGEDVFYRLYKVAFRYLALHRPKLGISGMALGWDQAVAEAMIDLKIPFIAAIPFKNQGGMWPEESQARYNRILMCAKKVVNVSENDGYTWIAMQQRNEWMVDKSNRLISLYNGDATGGTANCVKYATHVGLPIENVWDRWLKWQAR